MWKKLGNLKKFYVKTSRKGTNRMALLIDGPNMLRKEFNVDLDKVRDALEQFGDIVVGRVYLNQYASDKLIEAIVEMAVDGTELIFNKNLDTLVYMTRDADFLPAIRKAKERGKQIIVVGAEPGFSTAIQNIADHVIRVEEDFELDKEKLEQKKREREHSISSSESASEENTEVQKNSEPKKSSTDSFKDGISNSINWLKK